MYKDTFAAAEAIISVLPALLGAQADSVTAELQDLLAKAKQGAKVESEILDLLDEHPATRVWMRKHLPDSQGHEVASRGTLGYQELAGTRAPIPGAKYYKCPRCDYRWTQIHAWESPPQCPEHACDLEEDT